MICSLAEIQTLLGKASSITDSELGRINMLASLVEQTFKNRIKNNIEQATYTEFLPATPSRTYDRDGLIDVVGERVVVEGYGGYDYRLQLSNTPVRSITSLYEDRAAYAGTASGAFASGTLLTEGTHFYRDLNSTGLCRSGQLIRIGSTWPSNPRTVKVTYVAGYTAAELAGDTSAANSVNAAHLKMAVMLCLQETFDSILTTVGSGAAGQIASESLTAGGYSVSYDTSNPGVVVIPKQAIELARQEINMGAWFA